MTHFHLGVSYTRTSDYKTAQAFFDKYQTTRGRLTPLSEFYVNQGRAFFDFFFSQHRRSQESSLKAHQSLLKMKNPPPFVLWMSLDIQGHNHIQLGEIHVGLKMFQAAGEVAKKSKLKNLADESHLSYEYYKAEFAADIVSSLDRLQKLFQKTSVENDYSKSQIMLQIAKLLLLKGEFRAAQDFLSANFNWIYQNENKRKVAHMNTLLARLLFVRGQFIEALGIIKVAQSHLSVEIDKALLMPILGLEGRILRAMNQDDGAVQKQIQSFAKSIDNFLRHRIQQRQLGHAFSAVRGQDEIGDLIDEATQHLSADLLSQILEKQLLGILPEILKIDTFRPTLVMTELKDKFLILDSDQILVLEERLSKSLQKVLVLLSQGPQSKQTLIEKIWGYDYHPLRHDPVVYSTFVRLRKILGKKAFWIQNDEQYYYLHSGVRIVDRTVREIPVPTKTAFPSTASNLAETQRQLNFRQLESLESIRNFIGVGEYAKKWKVTKMTALRDLRGLADLGYLQISGKGRATRYFRAKS